jgi:predicted small lipoprotein YifL
MQIGKWIGMVALVVSLVACGNDSALEPPTNQKNEKIDLAKISTEQPVSQKPANEAKDLLSHYPEITKINAVNTNKILLLTIEIEHMKRFKLADIRKELKKKMKKSFPDLKVELSTDKKIVIELEKLEKQIQENKLTKKEIKKEVKRLIELSKEHT